MFEKIKKSRKSTQSMHAFSADIQTKNSVRNFPFHQQYVLTG